MNSKIRTTMVEIITKEISRATMVEIITKEISRATTVEIITKEISRATMVENRFKNRFNQGHYGGNIEQ